MVGIFRGAGGELNYSTAIIISLIVSTAAQAFAEETDLLFQKHEVLEITIQAPFSKIKRQNTKSKKFDGLLSYMDSTGKSNDIEVTIEVRGNYRLRKNVCKFPPLKVRFAKKSANNTLFENLKTLKLVTQCNPNFSAYKGYLMKEYLAYRILNLITPQSFKVRLMQINYVDGDATMRNFGFFIEDKKRLARRLGIKSLSIDKTSAVSLDSNHLNQVSLFQMLIGNVDWSATSGGSGSCCHNVKLFVRTGTDAILAIPYDFDLSGLVNAEYAVPDKAMGLDSITKRRYRGYCRNNAHLDVNIKLFNDRKPALLSLLQEFEHLAPKQKKTSIKYIESFYRIINNPKRVKRTILKFCHKSYFVEVKPD